MNEKRDNRDPLFRAAEEATRAAFDFASTLAAGVSEARRKRRELDEAEARADMEAESEMAEQVLAELERAAERGDREEAMAAYNRFRSLQDDLHRYDRLPEEMRERMRQREIAASRALVRLRERMRLRESRDRGRREEERGRRRG